MGIGIDWVALCVIGAAMVIAQIRQIPAQARYFVVAAAFAIVAVYRLQQGHVNGFNGAVVFVCVILAITNVVRALRYRGPGG